MEDICVILSQEHRCFPPKSNISPQKSTFALNLQRHCRQSDSCLNAGGAGPGARHLCLLEKPLKPSDSLSLPKVYSEELWCQNQTKMSLPHASQPCRIGWRALITQVPFFFPSILPSSAGYSRSASFSFSLPPSLLLSGSLAGDEGLPQVVPPHPRI